MLEHYKMCTTNCVVSLSLPLLLLSGGGQCGPGEERQLVIHQTWSQEPAGYNRQLCSIVKCLGVFCMLFKESPNISLKGFTIPIIDRGQPPKYFFFKSKIRI